jgi:hypothetical protein
LQTLKRVSGRLRKLFHGHDSVPGSAPHLLVVDDEESICFSMKEYFSHNGFIVDTARDVEEAERLSVRELTKSSFKICAWVLPGIMRDFTSFVWYMSEVLRPGS